jgi:hypothetical protein
MELISDTRLVGSQGKSKGCGNLSTSCQIMEGRIRVTVVGFFRVECVYLCNFLLLAFLDVACVD